MNLKKLTGILSPIGMIVTLAMIIGVLHQQAFAQTTDPFVGSWYIKVATSNQGFPPFEALHTYHVGGTVTEVSNLLSSLAETPAHGVWSPRGAGYDMTLQLFLFDSTGHNTGRLQLRSFVQLVGADSLTSQYALDVILPNGIVIPNVDTGRFFGKRLKPLPVVTSVQERGNTAPASFNLEQNYPNPFNPITNIRYQLQKPAQVSLRIYDAMGREVRTLVDRRIDAGVHHEAWDGKDNASRPVSSGVYYYRLRADQIERAKRMMLVK